MKPHDEFSNGDESGSGSGSDEEGSELVVEDPECVGRALRALNALRKARQHYDVLLQAAGGGAAVPAHRALLAAHAPYLLRALQAPESPPAEPGAAGAGAPVLRVRDVAPDALHALVDYMYTGRLAARGAAAARALYRAAWRLRLAAAAEALADRLLRRPRPQDCLELRALPDLPPHHLHMLDAYIAHNFDEICASGALSALPLVRIELLRPAAAAVGGADAAEAPLAVAEAALAFLRDHHADAAVEEVCARAHLVYVDEGGALRDCGELPAARGDAPELQEYRRAAEQRRAAGGGPAPGAPGPRRPPGPAALELGARHPRPDTAVLAARTADTNGGCGRRVTRALVSLRGRLAAARVSCAAGGAGGPRGAAGDAGAGAGGTRAQLACGRCAGGAAALAGRLLVCGGYDRARVLRSAEAYDPATNEWAPLPDMRSARARFPAACLGDAVYVFGGSDGQNELDSVDVYEERVAAGGGVAVGMWSGRGRMPLARSHAAAAACPQQRAILVLGGWAAGRSLPHVARYTPATDSWSLLPPLGAGRSQCAAAVWRGRLWALGGADAWHCTPSTESLHLEREGAVWQPGPALPTARRSAGAAVWRGRLVLCGGSDGAASLRRTDWLLPPAAAAQAGCAGAGGCPEAPQWAGGPVLRRARAALGLAAVRDVLYAVGGFDGKEFLSCVECLHAPEGEWTALCAPAPPAALHLPETKEESKADEGKEASKGDDQNGTEKVEDDRQPGADEGEGERREDETGRGNKGEAEVEGEKKEEEVKEGCRANGASA